MLQYETEIYLKHCCIMLQIECLNAQECNNLSSYKTLTSSYDMRVEQQFIRLVRILDTSTSLIGAPFPG